MDFADEVSGSEYFVIVLKNLRSNERERIFSNFRLIQKILKNTLASAEKLYKNS